MWNQSNLNTSRGEGGFLPQTNSAKKTATKVQRLIPCTCHEIVSAQQRGDTFVAKNDVELNLVTIVGIVQSLTEHSAYVDYVIDDRTGSCVTVKHYNDREAETSGGPEFRVDTYIKMVGHIKRFQEKNFINAIKIIPVKNYNEITHHMACVVLAHQQMRGATKAGDTLGESMVARGATGGQADQLSASILAVLKANNRETNGMQLQAIQAALTDCSPTAIAQKLEHLIQEGHVYSTIGEDWFKLTA